MTKVRKLLLYRLLLLITAVLLLTTLVPKVYSAESTPGSGITVGPPVVEYTIEKGQTASGIVKVNDYNPAAVTLYPQVSDFASKDETGQPAFFEPDPNRKFSLSNWIKFSPEPINLAVGELRAVQYQIVVPADAEPGGHYGVLFFSTKAPNDVKEGEAKVSTNLKVGQLILVKVPGNIAEKGSVASFKTKKYFNFMPEIHLWKTNETTDDQGKKTSKKEWNPSFAWNVGFTTRIQNNGNIHFKPKGDIQVKNILGQRVSTQTVNPENGNVLPESIRLFENKWTPAWWQFGYFKGNLNLTYGLNQSLTASAGFLVIPWWLIVVVILLIVLIAVVIRKKKKKRLKKQSS
ncbi:MAG: hypothetical protein WC437_03030 [Patescibacteria group bacterium]